MDLEFQKAKDKGLIPTNQRTNDIGGSWSAIRGDTGEATNLNLAHIQGYVQYKSLTDTYVLQTKKILDFHVKQHKKYIFENDHCIR